MWLITHTLCMINFNVQLSDIFFCNLHCAIIFPSGRRRKRWKIAFHSFILRRSAQFDSAERSAVLISVINAFIPASSTNNNGRSRITQPAVLLHRERIACLRMGKSIRSADKNIWALREIVMRAEWRRNYTAQWLHWLMDWLSRSRLNGYINGCTQPAPPQHSRRIGNPEIVTENQSLAAACARRVNCRLDTIFMLELVEKKHAMERDTARRVPAARQHAGRATWKGCILAAVKALNLVDAGAESAANLFRVTPYIHAWSKAYKLLAREIFAQHIYNLI